MRKKSPVVTASLSYAHDPKEVSMCKRPTGNDGMKTRGLDDIAVSFLGGALGVKKCVSRIEGEISSSICHSSR